MANWTPKAGDTVIAKNDSFTSHYPHSRMLTGGKHYKVIIDDNLESVVGDNGINSVYNDIWDDYFYPYITQTNDAGEVTSTSIDDTLKQRGNRYGKFSNHAKIAQQLKYQLAKEGFYTDHKFGLVHREAMDMILHKIARIVNGDPNYDDSWRDIAGYAQLVVDILNNKDT